MIEEFLVGVRHQFFNAELRQRRVSVGLTQKELAGMLGLPCQRFGKLETFRVFPTPEEAMLIATFFGVAPDTLFPEWLREWTRNVETVTTTHAIDPVSLDAPAQRGLLASGSLDEVEQEVCLEALRPLVQQALGTLTEREQRVIRLRYGFGEGEGMTLRAVAEAMRVTPERIRQIEAKALRKLRHPSRGKLLRPWAHEPEDDRPRRRAVGPTWWDKQHEELMRRLRGVEEGE